MTYTKKEPMNVRIKCWILKNVPSAHTGTSHLEVGRCSALSPHTQNQEWTCMRTEHRRVLKNMDLDDFHEAHVSPALSPRFQDPVHTDFRRSPTKAQELHAVAQPSLQHVVAHHAHLRPRLHRNIPGSGRKIGATGTCNYCNSTCHTFLFAWKSSICPRTCHKSYGTLRVLSTWTHLRAGTRWLIQSFQNGRNNWMPPGRQIIKK